MATETLVLPSGQEVEKGDILGHRASWLPFGLNWFSLSGATSFLFQWGYLFSLSVGLLVSQWDCLFFFKWGYCFSLSVGATCFLCQWGCFFSLSVGLLLFSISGATCFSVNGATCVLCQWGYLCSLSFSGIAAVTVMQCVVPLLVGWLVGLEGFV